MEYNPGTLKRPRSPEMQRAMEYAIGEGLDPAVGIVDVTEQILQEAERKWTNQVDKSLLSRLRAVGRTYRENQTNPGFLLKGGEDSREFYGDMGSYFRLNARLPKEDLAILVNHGLAAIANRCEDPSPDTLGVVIFHSRPRRFNHWRVLPSIVRTYTNYAKQNGLSLIQFWDLKDVNDYYYSCGFNILTDPNERRALYVRRL